MASSIAWSFTQLPAFAATVFPNVALWNVHNAAKNLTYQVGVSWPFEWASQEVTNKSALAMYVADGNAFGMTAAEGFKRRKPVDTPQPDTVVISIGYPLTDSVYDFPRRDIDFHPPLPVPQDPPSGADDFIEFIDTVLRPWVRSTVFPGVSFTRDALFGHSMGGLFVTYALISNPHLFDTFIAASPAIYVDDGFILDEVTRRLGGPSGLSVLSQDNAERNDSGSGHETYSKPAFFIGYGTLEQFPAKRRTETEAEFLDRKSSWFPTNRMTVYSHELYDRVRTSGKTRDVVLREYPGQDHANAGGAALMDAIGYFVDW